MLHFQDVGDGPLVVLLHGITEDSTAWAPVTELLAETHRVLALDLRGHGRSPVVPPYDNQALVADVLTTLGAVAPHDAPLLVGHSLGGLVATVCATVHPVRAVVSIDQVLDFGLVQQAALSVLPVLATPQFEAAFDAMFAHLEAGALPPATSARLKDLRRYDRDVVQGIWGGGLVETAPADLTRYSAELLGAVRTPYLALYGSEPSPAYRSWLAASKPDIVVEAWPGGGHYPHLVDPERFVERVRQLDASLDA